MIVEKVCLLNYILMMINMSTFVGISVGLSEICQEHCLPIDGQKKVADSGDAAKIQ